MKMLRIRDIQITAVTLALAWALAVSVTPPVALADEHATPGAHGYLVFRAQFHDPEALAAYGRAVGALVGEFGGRFLVVSAAPELVEGTDDGRRLVILRFPSVAKAREFWASEAYAQAKRLREDGGDVDAVLVEGIPGVL
ncbi:MAG: DUF1330 domain-containing protein [Gammaproteobacteria bacterium]|nr:DUF1330 domain-containing protein [Gammaproteobacteria bacterium]